VLLDTILNCIGRCIAARLRQPSRGCKSFTSSDPAALRRVLQPGDVLLVDGNQRISSAIKYLTQSSWSHAALYVGDALVSLRGFGEQACLIEANLDEGVVAVPLSKYAAFSGWADVCRSAQGDRIYDLPPGVWLRYTTCHRSCALSSAHPARASALAPAHDCFRIGRSHAHHLLDPHCGGLRMRSVSRPTTH
jgi:Permuted papain-like amidase enzyme, YaeF/YiiX, C92 family